VTANEQLGTIDDLTIRFERRLAASVERVWRAVTDVDEMQAWFPSRVEGDRTVGAPLTFPFDEGEADTFTGEVTEWEPMRVFAFTWNGDLLRMELEPHGDDVTVLRFTQTVFHLTEAARTTSGWHHCLAYLDAHLRGAEPPSNDGWKDLYGQYVERMGPPAGAVGDDGSVTFERTHFVAPERVSEVFADRDAWGATDAPPAELRVEPTAFGSLYLVRVPDADAATAARWHGLLLQLDMFLAAGQLVPDDAWRTRIADYEKLLAS
jgi:uncharacterized protein YndB with AHSA1/START domain